MNMKQYHVINHILCRHVTGHRLYQNQCIISNNVQTYYIVRVQEHIRKGTVSWFCRLLYPSIFICLSPTVEFIATILQPAWKLAFTTSTQLWINVRWEVSIKCLDWLNKQHIFIRSHVTSHLTSGGGIVDPPIGKKSGLLRLFLAIYPGIPLGRPSAQVGIIWSCGQLFCFIW